MEIFSTAGVCLTSLQALKICFSNILAGLHHNAICVASELTSPALVSKFYDPEYELTHNNPDKDPYMAFEKDFMRFMLSDGAGAVLVQDHPEGDFPLKIEWIEMTSYANELPTCMFMASELEPDGRLKSWKGFSPEEIIERGVLEGQWFLFDLLNVSKIPISMPLYMKLHAIYRSDLILSGTECLKYFEMESLCESLVSAGVLIEKTN